MASRLLFRNLSKTSRDYSRQILILNQSCQNIRRYAAATATAIPRKGSSETENSLPSTATELNNTADTKVSSSKAPFDESGEALLDDVFTGDGTGSDWSKSYFGLSSEPFPKEVAEILQAPLDPNDVEIKPGE